MRIAVVGATGTAGTPIAAELERGGHEVRRLSRHSETHPVDLLTGEGLDAALEGCEAVIDASNVNGRTKQTRELLVDGGRRLLAAEARAGVGHHVCISIVGIEKVPMGYYGVKVEQEEMVRAAGVPWSIVRATQFHQLLDCGVLLAGEGPPPTSLQGAAAADRSDRGRDRRRRRRGRRAAERDEVRRGSASRADLRPGAGVEVGVRKRCGARADPAPGQGGSRAEGRRADRRLARFPRNRHVRPVAGGPLGPGHVALGHLFSSSGADLGPWHVPHRRP